MKSLMLRITGKSKKARSYYRFIIGMWKSLNSVENTNKKELWKDVKRAVAKGYRNDEIAETVSYVATNILSFFSVLPLLYYILPAINYAFTSGEITHYAQQVISNTTGHSLQFNTVSWMVSLLIAFPPLFLLIMVLKYTDYKPFSMVIATVMAFVIGSASYIYYLYHSNLLCAYIARFALSTAYWVAFFLLMLYFKKLVMQFISSRFRRQNPEAALTIILVDLVWNLESVGSDWNKAGIRSYFSSRIGEAAFIIRKYLFRSFQGARTTARHQVQTSNRIADALLEKQRWLMTPMATTQNDLRLHFTSMLLHTLKGQWHNYEQVEAEKYRMSGPEMAKRTLQTLKQTVSALLPICIIFALRKSQIIELDSAVISYAVLISSAWMVVNLLYILDPKPDEKFAFAKSLVSFSRPGEKEKKAD